MKTYNMNEILEMYLEDENEKRRKTKDKNKKRKGSL